MKTFLESDFENIERFETEILDAIDPLLVKSEMARDERQFLNGIIRKVKPNIVVEIGVSAGGSSCIILNAIKDNHSSKLYSFDYNRNYYQDSTKKTGYIVQEIMPNIITEWDTYAIDCNLGGGGGGITIQINGTCIQEVFRRSTCITFQIWLIFA